MLLLYVSAGWAVCRFSLYKVAQSLEERRDERGCERKPVSPHHTNLVGCALNTSLSSPILLYHPIILSFLIFFFLYYIFCLFYILYFNCWLSSPYIPSTAIKSPMHERLHFPPREYYIFSSVVMDNFFSFLSSALA